MRCAICRGEPTRRVCARCRRDPANDGWREAPRRELSWPEPGRAVERRQAVGEVGAWGAGGEPRREYTVTERAVALGIWRGLADAEIARVTGLSRALVGRVRAQFMETT